MKYTKHYYAGSQRVVSKIGSSPEVGNFLKNWSLQTQIGGEIPINQEKEAQRIYKNAFDSKVSVYEKWKIPTSNRNGGFSDYGTEVSNSISVGNSETLNKFYYHSDHLGSTSYITDSQGNVTQHHEYIPFGETFVSEYKNAGYNSKYRFNGKEFDENTGFYYYGARYYNPKTSIWLGVDPLVEKTFQAYSFANLNPIRFIDPTGMSADPGEFEITHDKNGKEIKTKISNLGDKDGIDFNHHLDGKQKGNTEIVNNKTGFKNWIKDGHKYFKNYDKRLENVNYMDITKEFMNGSGPENSLFYGRDQNIIQGIRRSNIYHSARNEYIESKLGENSKIKGYIPVDFGLTGLLLSGDNINMQMVGYGGFSFYDIGNNQRLVLVSDSKSRTSLYYHLPFIKNHERNKTWNDRESTTHQIYIWIDNNIED